jgi:hypothetical protein
VSIRPNPTGSRPFGRYDASVSRLGEGVGDEKGVSAKNLYLAVC